MDYALRITQSGLSFVVYKTLEPEHADLLTIARYLRWHSPAAETDPMVDDNGNNATVTLPVVTDDLPGAEWIRGETVDIGWKESVLGGRMMSVVSELLTCWLVIEDKPRSVYTTVDDSVDVTIFWLDDPSLVTDEVVTGDPLTTHWPVVM